MRYIILLFTAIFIATNGNAEENSGTRLSLYSPISSSLYANSDSLLATGLEPQNGHESYIREFSYLPLPLVASSFVIRVKNKNFRGARNSFLPKFCNSLDNYIQYSPLALTLLLKASGVKSRNQWGRFLVSSTFSYAAMAVLVDIGKYSLKEMRPDGSTNNSFPSGHTATAFASATILHKEYGLTRSLWYSVAGYGFATMTGVMRVMNNRHWASDIVCGAGLGIFSVDLGYFIGDVIFKEKQTMLHNKPDINDFYSSPSFFNVSMGFGVHDQEIQIGDALVTTSKPVCAQAEMAYFFNPYIGAGARLSISSPVANYKKYSDSMGLYSLTAGAYVQYPLTERWAIGGKLIAGRMLVSGFEFGEELKVDQKAGFTYGIGANIAYAYRNNIAWRFNLDYDMYRMNIDSMYKGQHLTDKQTKGQLMLSSSMSVMF